MFFGLLNDLFPSVNPPRLVNDSLNACVREVCEDMNLWPDEAFVLKVIVSTVQSMRYDSSTCDTLDKNSWVAACTMGENGDIWPQHPYAGSVRGQELMARRYLRPRGDRVDRAVHPVIICNSM